MELIIAILITMLLIIIFSIGVVVGNKQGANQTIKQIKKDGGYFDMEITGAVYPYKTSSLNDEVPKEFLMGGDINRALHIAGVKEATPAKLAEWEDERKLKADTKQKLSVDELIGKLNKTDLQIKAGLIENTDKTGVDIKIQVKEIEPTGEWQFRITSAEREREQRVKIDFDALNFSRISNEARKQITEIVKKDLENKIKIIEQNTPEKNEDSGIGKKPKTQTDYQMEHKVEDETPAIDFMHNWIQEKSGKKDPISQKRKPKTTKEWEDEFDIGGNS